MTSSCRFMHELFLVDLKHCIRIYPIDLEIKDTTDIASYLDLQLEIDCESRLRRKLYDKKDNFNFPIVNFPIICSPIPTAPAYGVYISRLILYSRACGSYSEFFDRGFLPTRKLLNQGFLLAKLKLSLRNFYDLHHELLNHYGGSQMAKDMFCLFVVITIKYAIHAARK